MMNTKNLLVGIGNTASATYRNLKDHQQCQYGVYKSCLQLLIRKVQVRRETEDAE